MIISAHFPILLLLAIIAPIELHHAPDSNITWMHSVLCRGTETRLIDCPVGSSRTSYCFERQDAGVYCPLARCGQGSVRIIGDNSTHGHVEVCINNAWQTTCDSSWTDINARVTCRQLGLPSSCKKKREVCTCHY